MRVLSIFNDGSNLSHKIFDVIPQYSDTIFFLTINNHYTVYGMAIWVGVLHYLVIDTWGRPSWFPAGLFAVIDDTMPDCFHFKFYRKYDISAIWGYKALLDEKHYDGLIERQDEDLLIFFNNTKMINQRNNLTNQKDTDTLTIANILQSYYTQKMTTPAFIEAFNNSYNTLFSSGLHKKYQAMFDAVYAITKSYKTTLENDEKLKKSMQKLYFSINFPEVQFKHQ